MRRGLAWTLLGLACAGAVISLYLTYIFSRLHREPGWQSVCAISEALDCDAVVLSPYGSVAGAPLSFLGIWFYGFVMLVAGLELRARRPRFPRSLVTVLWVAAASAAATSVGLAAVSLLVLRTFCLFCAVLYALNGAMFAVAWIGLQSTGESVRQTLVAERRHWERHPFRAIGSLGAALAVPWIAGAAYSAGSGGSAVCAAVAAAKDAGQDQVTVTVY
ncbi:MAG TPA: vitamin K epoxide reductase family protein, partial [Caldilineaceae bacterium]|nr:vitamin K epoxide reductase family protein [Caldilineaceae bacterium]